MHSIRCAALSPIEPTKREASAAVGGSNLLPTTVGGKCVDLIVFDGEQMPQLADTAKGRAMVINPASPSAAVVVNAPTIGPHHG